MGTEPFATIYNRDVFILIDQSASMIRKDAVTGNQSRYEYLQEIVEGQYLTQFFLKRVTPLEKPVKKFAIPFRFSSLVATKSQVIRSRSGMPHKCKAYFWKINRKRRHLLDSTLERCLEYLVKQKENPTLAGRFLSFILMVCLMMNRALSSVYKKLVKKLTVKKK